MRQETFTCDVCGVGRGPSNHWWMAILGLEGVITFQAWDASCTTPNRNHLCGETCAAAYLTRYIAKNRMETPA